MSGDEVLGAPGAPPAPGPLGGVVTVTRTGGFAGMTMSGTVDLDQLDELDRSAWQSALGERLTEVAPAHQGQPDSFVYRVTSPDGVDLTVGDHELPDDLRTLLNSAIAPPP